MLWCRVALQSSANMLWACWRSIPELGRSQLRWTTSNFGPFPYQPGSPWEVRIRGHEEQLAGGLNQLKLVVWCKNQSSSLHQRRYYYLLPVMTFEECLSSPINTIFLRSNIACHEFENLSRNRQTPSYHLTLTSDSTGITCLLTRVWSHSSSIDGVQTSCIHKATKLQITVVTVRAI